MKKLLQLNVLGFLLLALAACGGGGSGDEGFVEQPLPEPEPEQVVLLDPELDADILILDESPQELVGLSAPVILYFDFDTAELRGDAADALDVNIDAVLASAGTIRLEGHADERGTTEYNLALGERRAKTVRDYLTLQGVPAERIETTSFGEENPIAFGQNEAAWSQNRRVELKIN